ncbi:cilia- and flagella-associated protein 299 isoform X13 [Canis lupus baileyi]|uniref:cilia- and flagella-associated protein 299 isoform X2 n=1 Tax=Canis lupus dingo TaxID=286419 RepID=UPI0020C3DCD3|nr:cilia- and flagella-associated protein 299 isoform X2 [Canis lupus dingo]
MKKKAPCGIHLVLNGWCRLFALVDAVAEALGFNVLSQMDESLARQLVELGYRGTGEVVKREDFEARKAAIEIAMLAERTQKKHTERGRDTGRGRSSSPWGARCGTQSQDPGIMTRAKGRRSTTEPPRTLTSAGKDLQDNFLKALALREEDNRNGKVSVFTLHSRLRSHFISAFFPELQNYIIKCYWKSPLSCSSGTLNSTCPKQNLSFFIFPCSNLIPVPYLHAAI